MIIELFNQYKPLFGVTAIAATYVLTHYVVIPWFDNLHSDHAVLAKSELFSTGSRRIMASGKIEQGVYSLVTNRTGKVMMLITLNWNTNMHIIALGSLSGSSLLKRRISQKWLEPVSLEGNFPDDFRMWCTRDKQMEVRQVFGPETMANFADFCRSYNFELFNNQIYISVAQGARDARDTTSMVTDISQFLHHNEMVLRNI